MLMRSADMLAVSASHPEPFNALAALYAATSPTELYKDRPYADPHILRYYVVVHDMQNGDLEECGSLTSCLDHVAKFRAALKRFWSRSGEPTAYTAPCCPSTPSIPTLRHRWKATKIDDRRSSTISGNPS